MVKVTEDGFLFSCGNRQSVKVNTEMSLVNS